MREKRVHKVGSNPIPISEISIGDLIDLVEKPDLSWLVMVNQIIPSCASGEGRIKITWIDNPGSTVRVMKTAQGDLEGLWRLLITKPWKNR